ncbi:E3 ubiquitin-protein ligase DCST1 [Periophthalmus magnuspinnatus]|uniref:E3 ubiquitin-protein ligase DCST1 n=1 Tax=Periophthalmus magnuspinnatus TaxID=409849 RepID=UPI00145B9989|nr:E3 ubiquitin-protein ligase DCST1 [Periophthalmus magnuspinnatus]
MRKSVPVKVNWVGRCEVRTGHGELGRRQKSCAVWRRCTVKSHPSPDTPIESEGPVRHMLQALLGAFSGAVLFLGVSHNLPLNLTLKLTVGAVFTGLCAVGGACSSFVRCSLLLTFPMMLGSRGRAYILLLLLSLLYSGPVHNMQVNLEACALSLTCNLDLQVNNSRVLWRQAVVPFISISQELMGSTADMEEESLNVSRTFHTFRQEVMRQYAKPLADSNDTQQQLTRSTMVHCNGVVQQAVQRCSDWFSLKWIECMSTVSVPILNHLLCVPMKFGFLCDIFRVMSSWCAESLPVEGNTGHLWDQLNRSMAQFQKEFSASMVLEEEQHQAVDGLILDQVFTDSVRDSLLRLRSGSELLMKVLQSIKSLTFITIILQAVGYLVQYRRDLRFDNVYITHNFRHIDTRRKTQGKHSVLPLSKLDRSHFIQPCSLRIHPEEAPPLFSGLVQTVSVGLLTLVLVGLDLVLVHVLQIVSRNTVTQFNITGVQQVDLRVGGDSIMARLLKKTVSAFNRSAHFDIDISNRACSVAPSLLPPSVYLSCAACVLMVALCSLLHIYSSRLRRTICASYYPQREKRRVLFLYNLLLQRNRKCSGSDMKCLGSDRKCSSLDRNCFTGHWNTVRMHIIPMFNVLKWL